MGNQLFQYSFALYAQKKLKTFFLLDFKLKDKYSLIYFKLKFPWNIFALGVFPQRIYCYLIKFYQVKEKLHQEISDISFQTPCLKNQCEYYGYFQDAIIAESVRKKLLNQFSVKKKYTTKFQELYPYFQNERVLVIHLRLKDYETLVTEVNGIQIKWLLPVDWYLKAKKLVEGLYDKVIVISDDSSKAKSLLSLQETSIIYSNSEPIVDFLCLVHAQCCIISNSSFAWWGSFLNQKPNKKIIAPVNWVGHNAGFEYPKGIMTKEFIWV